MWGLMTALSFGVHQIDRVLLHETVFAKEP